jgi:hypothetical protein
MFGSTLALAMGLMLLAVARFSADPGALDVVAALGIVFVAVACALHLGAILNELTFLPRLVRALGTAVSWVVFGLAIFWLFTFVEPGPELLLGLLMTPAAVGVVRLLVSRTDRGWAVAFLLEAVALIAVLGPGFLRRLMS